MLPPTLKVCGRTLLPFCIRHRVALEAIRSPIITPEKPITVSDVMFAARVLSTYDLKDTRKPSTLREKALAAWYTLRPDKLAAEVLALRIYFDAQSLWPRFWEKEEKANSGGIPWQLTIIAGLARNGIPLEQAWTMPESEAVWLYIANCKAEGSKIDLITDEEFEAMEREKASNPEPETKNTRN
jgi:hypothetical protein